MRISAFESEGSDREYIFSAFTVTFFLHQQILKKMVSSPSFAAPSSRLLAVDEAHA